jgi:uncharacterized protein (DUF3084 family)
MAAKRGNGNGGSSDPVVKALHEVVAEVHVVASELRGTNARLDQVTTRLDRVEQVLVETRQEQRAGFAELRGGLEDLRGEVHEGFAKLGQKIDSAADRDRHLEQSVQQLGERVAKLEARSADPR